MNDWKFTLSQYKQLNRGLLDSVDPDLSAFARAGGKIILWAGWAHQGVSPMGTVAYYSAVEHAAGGFAAASRSASYSSSQAATTAREEATRRPPATC